MGSVFGQKERSFLTKLRDISLLSFLKEFIYPLQAPSSRRFDDEKMEGHLETVSWQVLRHPNRSPEEEISTT